MPTELTKYEFVCQYCGVKFFSSKKSRIFCTNKCSSSYKARKKSEEHSVVLVCLFCKKEFVRTRSWSHLKTCSLECSRSLRRNGESQTVTRPCEWCEKEFTTTYKSRHTRFCSRTCARRKSWNLGLTVETSEKLRKTIDKSNETKTKKIVDGTLVMVVRGKGSWHESLKCGKCWCRSTYEKAYCEMLDSDNDVISYKVEPLYMKYKLDGRERNYVPDFLVRHVDGTQTLVEVKPSSMLTLPSNIAKTIAALEYCSKEGLVYKIITESDLFLSTST